MRIALTAALLVLSTTVAAQDGAAPERRAPLADVEDLEPAVDVGAPPPVAERPAAQASAQAAAAPALAVAGNRAPPRVMDSLDLGTTSITGNAELPKVLYIVPW